MYNILTLDNNKPKNKKCVMLQYGTISEKIYSS